MNIIFDVDGTLWDATEVIVNSWNDAAKAHGMTKTFLTAEIMQAEFGKSMDVIADDVFADVPKGEERDRLLAMCCEYEENALEDMTSEQAFSIIYPSVADVLQKLSSRHKLFIVSNCQNGYIEKFISKSGTAELFTDFMCFGDTGLPKGDTIKALMDRNGLSAQDTVYIGDTMGDFLATKYAGLAFIHASYGFGSVPEPDYIIKSFEEIPGLVD